MTATAHALVGAVIAAKVGNPFLAYPASLGSHFLMDLIPHWDTGTHRKQKTHLRFWLESLFDLGLGILLVQFLFGTHVNPLHLWIAVFFSQVPDWFSVPYLFFKTRIPPFFQVYEFQSWFDKKTEFALGISTQLVVVGPLLYFASPTPVQQIITSALAFLAY
ncbi:hypothetical protein A2Z23_02290 [Candidatus Curtissbacteria bacterium RBG_16_39_7]|uniref:Uncharacterized protein n=1 Tax=Candidatus Curtissbacteria bacterium RBG_16_39_7 TaxID=1797707 RepID=A0A1F5G2V6_9BACT|nr:MAG: hypothetical protein A2Z23_02290 [Candidatus Curtissbacteria bacterium RBG_16_39_7]